MRFLVAFAVVVGVAGGALVGVVVAVKRNGDDSRTQIDAQIAVSRSSDDGMVSTPSRDAASPAREVDDRHVLSDAPTRRVDRGAEAQQLNDLGGVALRKRDYEAGRDYFQKAYAAVPERKFLFNLATAEYLLGHFRQSVKLSKKLLASSPPPALAAKAQKLLDINRREMTAQNIPEEDPGL